MYAALILLIADHNRLMHDNNSMDQGTLLVSPGSHTNAQLLSLRNGYGRTTVGADGVQSGWVTDDPTTLTKQVCFIIPHTRCGHQLINGAL